MIFVSSEVKIKEFVSFTFKDEKSLFSFAAISTLIKEYFLLSIFIYSPIFNKIEQLTLSFSLKTSKI